MKHKKIAFSLFLSVFFIASAGLCADFGSISLTEFYNYDRNAPLNADMRLTEETDLYRFYRVEYDSAWGRRVPAVYVVPKTGTLPCPAVIFGHGFMGRKEDVREDIDTVAGNGYCALSIDMWYHGERSVEGKMMYGKHLYEMREGLAGSVIDLRRAVDFLMSRTGEVDPDKISYLGASMGGIIGGLFAGVDSRIKTPVLIVGGGDWSYLIKNSIVVQVDLGGEGLSRKMAEPARRILAPVDPINTVQMISPRPLLMINAKHDILVNPYSAKKMFVRSGTPKRILWMDSGHGVPLDDAVGVIIDWYNRLLKGGHEPDFDVLVEGWKTEPVEIDLDMKMRPPVEAIPYEEYMAYNRELPLLSFRDSDMAINPHVSTFRIRYQSTRDRMVKGILNLPVKGHAPYPCLIFIHDLGGSARDMDLVADMLARNGIASVSINVFEFRNDMAGNVRQLEHGPYNTRNMFIQSVQDVRRLVDFLEKLEPVTIEGLSVLGIGLGGVTAIDAAALDERMRTVMTVDTPDKLYSYLYEHIKNKGFLTEMWQKEDTVREALMPVEPEAYISNVAPRKIALIQKLIQAGTGNQDGHGLYMAAAEPKEIIKTFKTDKDVNETIGLTLKSVVRILKEIYEKSADIDNMDYRKREIVMDGIMDTTQENSEAKRENSRREVESISTSKTGNEEGSELIISARISGQAEDNVSVIAVVSEENGPEKYIYMSDSGENADRKRGDGIYTGVAQKSGVKTKIRINVGGIDEDGKPIIEKGLEATIDENDR